MTSTSFYIQVIKALEEIGAPYMIVGAFAGLAFGINRATFDIDILVNLDEEHCEPLANHFPLPRYYADPVMMRNSIRSGIMFNLIDTQEGIKADLVPLQGEPHNKAIFDRRTRQVFTDESGASFEAWCAHPTDIILGKLKAWNEGRSNKHPQDIFNILTFTLSDLEGQMLDLPLIAEEAKRFGPECQSLWQDLVSRVEDEIKNNKENPT